MSASHFTSKLKAALAASFIKKSIKTNTQQMQGINQQKTQLTAEPCVHLFRSEYTMEFSETCPQISIKGQSKMIPGSALKAHEAPIVLK